MGADASLLASAMSSPIDFSQLLWSDSEMPPRCHGLYHCTCLSCSQRGLAAFLELQRSVSLDPGLLQFLSFAKFACHIKTGPCPCANPPRSSGKKLPCQTPSSSLSSQNAEVRRGRRSAIDLQSKARDTKPAVSERVSHLTFLASYWVAESAISTDSVNSYQPSYLSTYLNFTTYLLQSTSYFCHIYALPTVLSITECAFWGTFYCLLVCH
jgi:hypothetical protein